MTESSHAVFLSYASEDAESAQRIAKALRAAGIEVWFDKNALRGGDAWDRMIRQQIRDCALFIPLVSHHSQERLEGYFRLEWKLAVDRSQRMAAERTFIVPVVVDSTRERDALVPDAFRDVQWTHLSCGETPPAFLERVQRLLSPETESASAAATEAPSDYSTAERSRKAVPSPWRFKLASWAIGAVLAVALSYFIVDKLWLSKRTASTANSTAPSAQGTIPEKSIAVLPFVDLSEKHDQEYFADGIAEETLNQLAKIPGLKVIGRTSSFQFKGKADDLRKIGAALGAAYVLEGSVRKSADRVRVTGQLISTNDGSHRWSDTYDAKLDDVLRIQDDMAISLARALELTVAAPPIADATSTNPEAYDLYLRGLHALDAASLEGCEQAIELFNQALRLEPTSARTLVSLAWAHDCIGVGGFLVPGAGIAQARGFAIRTLQVDPKSAAAHLVLADLNIFHDWDWAAAQREIDNASKLAPPDARAFITAATLASAQGQNEHAIELLQQAVARDPLNPLAYDQLGRIYSRTGRYVDSETTYRRALQIAPQMNSEHYWLAIAMLMQGRFQDALMETERAKPNEGQYLGGSVVLYAMHRRAESDAALKKAIEQNASDWPSGIARAYSSRGDHDQAMTWLERAYQARDPDLIVIKDDPQLQNLETDPRYKAFLKKMNVPE